MKWRCLKLQSICWCEKGVYVTEKQMCWKKFNIFCSFQKSKFMSSGSLSLLRSVCVKQLVWRFVDVIGENCFPIFTNLRYLPTLCVCLHNVLIIHTLGCLQTIPVNWIIFTWWSILYIIYFIHIFYTTLWCMSVCNKYRTDRKTIRLLDFVSYNIDKIKDKN